MTPLELQNIIIAGENETTEFKTSFNKEVIETLVAFSNYKGGKIILGVTDNKEIKGVSINSESIPKWINEIKQNTNPQIIPIVELLNINDKNIVVFEAVEFPVKPVAFKDKYFKRVSNSNHVMNLTEVSNEHLKTINSSWDYYVDPNHNFEHISLEKVANYIREYENWNQTKVDFDALEFLGKKEIIRNNHLTFGAYLLFAKDTCIVSDIQLGRFKSPTKIIDSLSLDTTCLQNLTRL